MLNCALSTSCDQLLWPNNEKILHTFSHFFLFSEAPKHPRAVPPAPIERGLSPQEEDAAQQRIHSKLPGVRGNTKKRVDISQLTLQLNEQFLSAKYRTLYYCTTYQYKDHWHWTSIIVMY